MQNPSHDNKFKLKVLAFKGLLKSVWASSKIERVIGEEHLLKFIQEDQPVILCYWHQAHIMSLKYLLDKRDQNGLKLSALVSPSKDGEMAAEAMKDWGVDVVRGSSSRTGAQAMRNLYEIIKKGFSPVITPDGPRGPAFEFKQGAIMLSQISQAPILPIAVTCSKAWQLNSWDKFMIPKPFAKVTIAIGEPVTAPKRMSEEEQEALRQQMGEAVKALEQQYAYNS